VKGRPVALFTKLSSKDYAFIKLAGHLGSDLWEVWEARGDERPRDFVPEGR
jgi:hypothetical protein